MGTNTIWLLLFLIPVSLPYICRLEANFPMQSRALEQYIHERRDCHAAKKQKRRLATQHLRSGQV